MTTEYTKDITVDIMGVEVEATVKFDYTDFEPATMDCPGCDEELAIGSLVLEYHKENSKIRQHVDASYLLDIPDIHDEVLAAIKDAD